MYPATLWFNVILGLLGLLAIDLVVLAATAAFLTGYGIWTQVRRLMNRKTGDHDPTSASYVSYGWEQHQYYDVDL